MNEWEEQAFGRKYPVVNEEDYSFRAVINRHVDLTWLPGSATVTFFCGLGLGMMLCVAVDHFFRF